MLLSLARDRQRIKQIQQIICFDMNPLYPLDPLTAW
jgi:hypothetical protein